MKNEYKLRLFIIFLSLLAVITGGIHAAEPKQLSYNTPVRLIGTIIREFDMSFVDSNLSPLQDPKEVARAIAEARRNHPVDWSKSKLHIPYPHFILRLARPISVQAKRGDLIDDQERNISEIDLGGSRPGVREKDLKKTRFVVSGTLWHAVTIHHLRPVQMNVTDLDRAD